MEEHNRKLLEWTGVKNIITIDNGDMIWRDKDGNGWCLEYFTNSLDACFERLVPKLNKDGWDVSLEQEFEWWLCTLITQKEPYIEQYGKAKAPALALCRAVEKLIDGEKKC